MKKLLLTAMFMAAISIATNAQSGTIGDLTWTYSGSVLTVSGQGEMPDYTEFNSSIPWYGYNIYSVVIEEGVTSIGAYAFSNKTALYSVSLPKGLISIGAYAFYNCSNTSFTSITLPEGLTTIDSYAFHSCSRLSAINIPESVTSVGSYAFAGTSWLSNQSNRLVYVGKVAYIYNGTMPANTQIELLEGTTGIAASAFSGRSTLISITIPKSVTNIGSQAFYNCTGLTEIVLPERLITIGSSAFYNCSNLESVTIPESIESVGSNAFSGTLWFNEQSGVVYVGKIACGYSGEMPEDTHIEILEGTVSIANSAFSNCTKLSSVTFPASLSNIEGSAFYGCTGLSEITFPETVTTIGEQTFYNCSKLATINILNAEVKIGTDAFTNTALYDSYPTNSVVNIGTIACQYKGLLSVMQTAEIAEGTTMLADNLFQNATSLLYITIPRSVTTIGENAFNGCTNLSRITIPENVTSIAKNAFTGCTRLTNVTWLAKDCMLEDVIFPNNVDDIEFGKTVRSIPDYIFKNNTKISSLIIPHSVESVGKQAFFRCTNLYSISIGAGLESIGDLAFYGCSDVSNITCYAIIPPAATPYCFLDVPISATVQIPCGTISLYEAANEWKYFWSFLEIIAYTANGYSANAEFGSVSVAQTCAEAVFTAEAAEGCRFVRWSNNSDANPLIVPLSENVELIAEFESETTGIDLINGDESVIYTHGNNIIIKNSDAPVAVYELTGRVLYQGLSREIPVTKAGIYIVETDGRREKVVID